MVNQRIRQTWVKTNLGKVVKTSKMLQITSITVKASGGCTLHIGTLETQNQIDVAVKAGIEITWTAVDAYQTICPYVAGANCRCTENKWLACASSGCPKAGTYYCK